MHGVAEIYGTEHIIHEGAHDKMQSACHKMILGIKQPHLTFYITCMATGKSFCASGGKKTSTAFLEKAVLPDGGVPTSMTCS